MRGPRCGAVPSVWGWWPGGAPCAGPRLSRRSFRAEREGRRGGRGSVVSGRPLRLRGSGACSATAGPRGGPLGLRRPRPGRVSFGPWLVVVAACSAPLRASGPLPLWPAPSAALCSIVVPSGPGLVVLPGGLGRGSGGARLFGLCPPVGLPPLGFLSAPASPLGCSVRCGAGIPAAPCRPSLVVVRPCPAWARSRRACRPLARARAFFRVRSDRGAHPTRKARRGTRRASEPGRGSKVPREGGKTAQGNACRPPSACSVRYQLRYQNLKALPQIGQYRQYSRTGYPQKGQSGPSGTMTISVLLFSPFYWTVSS